MQCSEVSFIQHAYFNVCGDSDCEVNNTTFILFQRMYKSGDSDSMHKYTLHSDHPDFIRAKINAQQISNVRVSY